MKFYIIKWAILENNGKLSIITYRDSISNFPDPLISDGVVIYDNLKKAKIDEKTFFENVLLSGVKNIKEVKLCIYVDDKLSFVFKK